MKDYNISFFQYKLKEWEIKNNKKKIDLTDEVVKDGLSEQLAEYKMWITHPEWRDEDSERSKEIRKEGILKTILMVLEVANSDNINLQELLVDYFRNDLKSII